VPARPLADDERRDFEVHIRRRFAASLAIQVKTAKRFRHGTATAGLFQFKASMQPTARDMWSPIRLPQRDLGPRMVEILKRS
jgi:hypothetical protein